MHRTAALWNFQIYNDWPDYKITLIRGKLQLHVKIALFYLILFHLCTQKETVYQSNDCLSLLYSSSNKSLCDKL